MKTVQFTPQLVGLTDGLMFAKHVFFEWCGIYVDNFSPLSLSRS
jgi:hypothetical protein